MDTGSHGTLWSAAYTIGAVVLGLACLMISAILIPRILDHFTPQIDEQKEIVRGNRAAADYYGRIVGALIIGVSIIIAAALIAGLE